MISNLRPGSDVLKTRLNRPVLPKDMLARPRLFDLLDIKQPKALTLVVAPAGFGKTTLISSWLNEMRCPEDGYKPDCLPSSWLSMDEKDSNYKIFLLHFIAALRKIYPDACQDTFQLIQANKSLKGQLIPILLTNEISELPNAFILVLDDFHRASSPEINELVAVWIKHWPTPMHLVLISRFQPSLPLAGIKSRGALTEIRSKNLRFSPEESANYVRKASNRDLEESKLGELLDPIEGWVSGLKLLSLAINDIPLERAVSDLSPVGNRDFINYLFDEVINQMSPAMQKTLMKMSILDSFTPALCRSLIEGDDLDSSVTQFIDNLIAADLFITVLDSQSEEMRFHHIFRDILYQILMNSMSPEQVRMLHLRVATFLLETNEKDRAFEHAIKSDNSELITRAAWEIICEALNIDDRFKLYNLAKRIAEKDIRIEPLQLILGAWLKLFNWDIKGIKVTMAQLEAILLDGTQLQEDEKGYVIGQKNVLKAIVAYNTNENKRAIELCTKALQLLPDKWSYARGQAIFYLGLSMQAQNGLPEAADHLQQIYRLSDKEDYSLNLRNIFALSLIYFQGGDFEASEQYASILLDHALARNLVVIQGFALTMLGAIDYQWNKLDLAEKWYQELYSMSLFTMYTPSRYGFIGLSSTLQAMGRGDEALQIIDELCKLEIELIGQISESTKATRLLILSKSGLRSEAEKWVEDYDKPFPNVPLIYGFAEPLVFKAKLLIIRNKRKDEQLIRDILSSYDNIARETNNAWAMAECFALQALFEMNTGNKTAARNLLIQSLEPASKGNLIRIYIDLGSQMYELLQQVGRVEGHEAFIKMLISAFEESKKSSTLINIKPNKMSEFHTAVSERPLYESLTSRELEVLRLMADAISLQEIADRLYIAYSTTKRHSINIYSKLGVHNRWEAVAFAKNNGII